MRAFVTGGTGFAGSHLVEQLLTSGAEVYALVHGPTSHQDIPEHPAFHSVAGNLLDAAELISLLVDLCPDVIFHLAGQASPPRSWEIPAPTFNVNTIGTINVLEAARQCGQPRVVIVTSADVYGIVKPDQLPLTEASQPRPRHPYGVSKLAAGMLAPIYWEHYRLPVIEARPFNHVGPRQMLGFVVPDFASQVAQAKLGLIPTRLRVGNLDAQRDFTDVRDVARAYRLLAEKGQPGEEYLICSGQPVSIHYLLTTLLELAGIKADIEYDPARMRPSDTPCLYGSFRKIQQDTGWQPEIHLRQALADALAEWLDHFQANT